MNLSRREVGLPLAEDSMQDSWLDQPFQWAPPASTNAISDPMATATRVISFMVSPLPNLSLSGLLTSC